LHDCFGGGLCALCGVFPDAAGGRIFRGERGGRTDVYGRDRIRAHAWLRGLRKRELMACGAG